MSLTCPSCKYNRVEILDYFRQWIEDRRHAIFSPHSYFCSFFIRVAPSIEAGELGAPPATRYAQTVGEAPAGVASAWGDRLLIKKYASSSDRCSRRLSVGVLLESMVNY